MTSNGLRTFAAGLFLATVVLGGTVYLAQDTHSEKESELLTIDEMKTELANHGLAVLPESELNQLRADQNREIEEHPIVEIEKTVYVLHLEITPGMTSFEIADRLVNGQIILNRDEFLNVVNQLELSTSLKTGFFELSSDMTIEEIIQTIS